jgi:hypothetical protein
MYGGLKPSIGKGLWHRPAGLYRLAESIPWASKKFKNTTFGQQMGSAAFFVSVCKPTFVCCFLGVVNIVLIPEFLAIEMSIKFAKYANIRLSIEQSFTVR